LPWKKNAAHKWEEKTPALNEEREGEDVVHRKSKKKKNKNVMTKGKNHVRPKEDPTV